MISKLKKFLAAHRRGFTLLETLIAVLVLMSAIAGPLTIVQKGLQATTLAKDQASAYYLAQEAVEYVRFIRDTNKLSGGDWLTGVGGDITKIKDLSPCVSTTGATQCTIDALQNTVTACSGTCSAINYDSTNNYFSYTTGIASIFTRTVSIQTPVGVNDCTTGHGCEATLTVVVSWCDQSSCRTTPRKVTLREDMFDWQ